MTYEEFYAFAKSSCSDHYELFELLDEVLLFFGEDHPFVKYLKVTNGPGGDDPDCVARAMLEFHGYVGSLPEDERSKIMSVLALIILKEGTLDDLDAPESEQMLRTLFESIERQLN